MNALCAKNVGFSLVELTIVVVILGVLATYAVPRSLPRFSPDFPRLPLRPSRRLPEVEIQPGLAPPDE
ncbi:MAG: prepilin-type N-terminal cleavage/methylation domain-containing protein [Planctomycetota bacterium]